ncbi:hypothetical protein BGY98DRAFT_1192597 [Russula aff. rugulosa BPL654]|nr:hypothetical protein BGY98DRAFT_1192597 [Russula aff. rugulosa BPL654]
MRNSRSWNTLFWARKTDSAALMLPETLQAPNLHHSSERLRLSNTISITPTATGLVTLYLTIPTHPPTFNQMSCSNGFHLFPSWRLSRLALHSLFPTAMWRGNSHIRQSRHTLHFLTFACSCSKALALTWKRCLSDHDPSPRIAANSTLQSTHVFLPRLQQFVNTRRTSGSTCVIVFMDKEIYVGCSSVSHTYPFVVTVIAGTSTGRYLPWHKFSMGLAKFLCVEHLTFRHDVHSQSSEEHNDVDRIEWRNLLRPFSNVKTLRVEDGLVEQLSHCLRLEDGELPLELLPELQELTYSGSGDTDNAFTSFIDARQNAGRPVTLYIVPISCPQQDSAVRGDELLLAHLRAIYLWEITVAGNSSSSASGASPSSSSGSSAGDKKSSAITVRVSPPSSGTLWTLLLAGMLLSVLTL